MRRIAKVLDVEPADLLEIAAFVNFRNEVEPYIGTIGPGISGALLASELLILRIVGSELEHLGLCSGTEAVFNVSKTAIGQIKTGDVVLIEITRKADGEAIRVPRQFIAPGSLVTNKRGRNIVFGFDEPRFDIAIVGVLVQPQT